jgi:hypothetical protein
MYLEESMSTAPNHQHYVYGDGDGDELAQTAAAEKPTAASSCVWRGLTVSRNAQGQAEAFALGPDGFVWSYLTNPAGYTEGRLISTGLEAHSFAVAKLARHRKLVVGVQGTTLSWVTETGESQPRWHEPAAVKFDGLQGAQSISQVHALERDDEVLIGVLVHYPRGTKLGVTQFWVSKWTGDNLYFMDTPVPLNGNDPIANEFLFGGLTAPATANVPQRRATRGGANY